MDHDYHTTHLGSRPETVGDWFHRNAAEYIGMDEDTEDSVLPLGVTLINLVLALATIVVTELKLGEGYLEKAMKWALAVMTCVTFVIVTLAYMHYTNDNFEHQKFMKMEL